MLGRGRPSRDGNILRGLAFPGEVATGIVPGLEPVGQRGDSGRTCEGTGDAVLSVFAGDAGRATREVDAIDGLADLGVWADRRATPLGVTGGGSVFPWELGPGTRRNRSSSCVLSLGDRGPTRDHTFSPTREYASLGLISKKKLPEPEEKTLA
jgi:hypothetical protein